MFSFIATECKDLTDLSVYDSSGQEMGESILYFVEFYMRSGNENKIVKIAIASCIAAKHFLGSGQIHKIAKRQNGNITERDRF